MYFVYISTKILVFSFIDTIVIWRMCMCMERSESEGMFRSIGGRDARSDEFPYVLRVEYRELPSRAGEARDGVGGLRDPKFVCTAAALTSTAMLSAAHCCEFPQMFEVIVIPEDANIQRLERSLVIRYGSATSRPSDDDSFSKVLACIRPPSVRTRTYMDPVMSDDLALLETQPIPLSVYARVSAIDYRTAFGQRLAILGYGLTNGTKGLGDTLELGLPLQVVDAMWSKCDVNWPYPLLCAVESCAHHALICGGDSGGPVMHASGVLGVISNGPDHKCQIRTDVTHNSYIANIVPLSIHLDWIADTIALMPKY